MHHLPHLLDHIDPLLRQYGYGFIAIITFGEAFGLPLPGEIAIIAASALCQRGSMSPTLLALVVAVSAFAGDNVGYLIGRFGGRPLVLRLGRHIGITPQRMGRVESAFCRYGAWMVVVARFVVVLRQLNGVVSGIAGLPWARFAVANAAGAVIWACVWSYAPFFLTSAFTRLF